MSGIRITRRDLFRGGATIAFTVSLPGLVGACSSSDDDAEKTSHFKHGVASGDPLPDAVILWTRVTTADTGGAGAINVEWQVADDPQMATIVKSGSVTTDAEKDFTVKVDVTGLGPGKTYYYRFKAEGESSRVGRTRTAPTGAVPRLRFAVMSCASFAHGYFHAYHAVSELRDLDAIIHLGDYVYEYGTNDYGDVRPYEPTNECKTLADYRTRHSLYKRDPDLQGLHAQHVFIDIWDDHEVANDGYKDGAENHTEGAEGVFADRKAAGMRAYREWMPIREQEPGNKIFRKLAFGDLVDLLMLDTRYWARSKQAVGITGPPPPPDPSRTILGDDQEAWMKDQLTSSKAKWKLLGQQIMVGQLLIEKGKTLANGDQWQGYPEARTRLLDFMKNGGVKDIIVLTGDIHSSWGNELVYDPNDPAGYDPATGRGSVGVEFVTPGVTSPGIPTIFLGLVDQARPFNQHIRFSELTKRGFLILDVTPERVQGAWYHFEDITVPERQTPAFASAWSVKSGEARLVNDPSAAAPRDDAPAFAPT